MIILGIIKPLGGEFSPIRDFIQQEISDMFEDFKSLSDIKDFQAKLVTEFTTRSLIKNFRNKLKSFQQEFEKERIPVMKDWENAKELAEAFIKLSNDSSKDSTLFKERGVIDLCKEKQIRVCGQCLSSNYYLKQIISTKDKLNKRFIANCKGKHLNLKEMPEALKNI